MTLQITISEYNNLLKLLKNCHSVGCSVVMYNDVMLCYNILYKLIGNRHYCRNNIVPMPSGYVYNIDNIDDVIENLTISGRKNIITVDIDEYIDITVTFKDDNATKTIRVASSINTSEVSSSKRKYVKDTKSYEVVSEFTTISFDSRLRFSDIFNIDDTIASITLSDSDVDTLLSGKLLTLTIDHLDNCPVVRIARGIISHMTSSTKISDQTISIYISNIHKDNTATMFIISTIKSFDYIDIYKFIPYNI